MKMEKNCGEVHSARADAYARKLQRMIQCATVSVKDTYDDTEFARLRGVMEECFPLVHEKAVKMTFGEDCWLYRIKGKDASKCIVLMSHHDVAAVRSVGKHLAPDCGIQECETSSPENKGASGGREALWRFPGFSGEIADGRIWGRGTVDTKTSLFAEFMALEELLAKGYIPACDVYLASSHNEEIAGDGIPRVVEYFREKGIRPRLVLDEGGAVIDPPMPGIRKKCAVLAVHEKGRHTLELWAKENGGHGGLSGNTETPAMRMARFMVRVQKEQPYVRRFSPQLCAMFTALAPHMTFPMRFVFSHLKLFSGILKYVIPKLNAQAGAMLGTTGAFQEVETRRDQAGGCRGKLMLRCVDDEDLAVEIRRIRRIAHSYGITVRDAETGNEFHRPAAMEGRMYRLVTKCMERSFPDAIVMPFILPAGTDARHFSEICPAVYRFAPLDIDGQQFRSVHGVNENIHVDAVPKAVDFYKRILKGIGNA